MNERAPTTSDHFDIAEARVLLERVVRTRDDKEMMDLDVDVSACLEDHAPGSKVSGGMVVIPDPNDAFAFKMRWL